MATSENESDIVKILLDKRANKYAQNNNGKTARDIAVDKGFIAIVEMLDKDEI